MNRLTLLALAGLALTPLCSHALPLNDDFSLQLKLTGASDYRSRGISMTLGDPGVQVDTTLIHSSGLYAGVYAANVDFGLDLKSRLELDYYAGYYWQATDTVSLDVGYLKYTYPKESQFNQSEYYAILSAYGVQLGANYSNDLFDSQDSLYSYLGYQTELPAEVGLQLRYGRMDFKDPVFWARSGASGESYREWEAKLSRDLFGVTWGLSYVDTDLSESECTSFYGVSDVCSATVVASVSKSF